MEFTFSYNDIVLFSGQLGTAMLKLPEKQKLPDSIGDTVKEIRKLADGLTEPADIKDEKTYKSSAADLKKLEGACSDLQKAVTKTEQTEAVNDADDKVRLSEHKGAGDKLKKLRKAADTAERQARADAKSLGQWWASLQDDETVKIPVDPKVTDILESTRKNLAIAIPPKQLFDGSVSFSGVPQLAVTEFKKEAEKVLQKKISEMLAPIKQDIGRSFQKYSDEFEKADQRSDTKTAAAIFDNINVMVDKDLKPRLETALRQAADATLTDLGKQTRGDFATIMRLTKSAAKVHSVTVDLSGVFQVELVTKDSNPMAALVTKYDSKVLRAASRKYDMALKRLDEEWKDLAKTARKVDEELEQETLRKVKVNALLDDLGGSIKGIEKAADEMEKQRDAISDLVKNAQGAFEKESRSLKDNMAVSKRLVEDFRSAAAAFQKHLQGLKKEIADSREAAQEFNEPRRQLSGGAQESWRDRNDELRKIADQCSDKAEKKLDISELLEELDSAAQALRG